MTGRGGGFCKTGRSVGETGTPSDAGFGRGAGFGHGFRCGRGSEMRGYVGGGLGRNRGAIMEAYPEEAQIEIDRLKMQAESMKCTLEALNQRLSEMEKSE